MRENKMSMDERLHLYAYIGSSSYLINSSNKTVNVTSFFSYKIITSN